MNPIDMLEEEHRGLRRLFRQFQKTKDPEAVARRISDAVCVYSALEREFLYPAVRREELCPPRRRTTGADS